MRTETRLTLGTPGPMHGRVNTFFDLLATFLWAVTVGGLASAFTVIGTVCVGSVMTGGACVWWIRRKNRAKLTKEDRRPPCNLS